MKLLVIDIDGTIAQIPEGMVPSEIINRHICVENNCDYAKADGCYRLSFCANHEDRHIERYYTEEGVLKLKPFEKMREMVNSLVLNFNFYPIYVSARTHDLQPSTYKWCKEHDFPLGKVFCVGNSEGHAEAKMEAVENAICALQPDLVAVLEDDTIIAKEYERRFGAVNLFKVLVTT